MPLSLSISVQTSRYKLTLDWRNGDVPIPTWSRPAFRSISRHLSDLKLAGLRCVAVRNSAAASVAPGTVKMVPKLLFVEGHSERTFSPELACPEPSSHRTGEPPRARAGWEAGRL